MSHQDDCREKFGRNRSYSKITNTRLRRKFRLECGSKSNIRGMDDEVLKKWDLIIVTDITYGKGNSDFCEDSAFKGFGQD